MKNNDEIVHALNNIMQFLHDSAECFKKHVYNVNDNQLKELFAKYVISREEMLDEIKIAICHFGKDIEVKGTLLGKTHMLFENIKSYLTNGDAFAITKEVRRGENVLIDYYKEALKLDLPMGLKQVLIKHLAQIEEDIKKADLLSIK